MSKTPFEECNNCLEDFTLAQRAEDCPTCLINNVHCLGNYHPKKQGLQGLTAERLMNLDRFSEFVNRVESVPTVGSPRPDAVFVLVVKASETLSVLGTAFAIDCPNRNIAMTTAHCVFRDNIETGQKEKVSGTLYLASRIRRDVNGALIISAEEGMKCFRVMSFYHNTADIALLRIDGDEMNPSFSSPTFPVRIPLCPSARLPKRGGSYGVRIIQSPATVFHHMHLQILEPEFGNWVLATMVQDDYFFVETTAGPGSSGGPAINRNGEVVGMVQSGMIPSMSVNFEEAGDDTSSQWTAKVNASGQIAGLVKIVKVKIEHHPSFPGLVGESSNNNLSVV